MNMYVWVCVRRTRARGGGQSGGGSGTPAPPVPTPPHSRHCTTRPLRCPSGLGAQTPGSAPPPRTPPAAGRGWRGRRGRGSSACPPAPRPTQRGTKIRPPRRRLRRKSRGATGRPPAPRWGRKTGGPPPPPPSHHGRPRARQPQSTLAPHAPVPTTLAGRRAGRGGRPR